MEGGGGMVDFIWAEARERESVCVYVYVGSREWGVSFFLFFFSLFLSLIRSERVISS